MTVPITKVTVLEDRAAITRTGTTPLAAGQHRIVVDRVAPVLADKTLTAVATGGRVLDVRCERYLAPWRDPSAEAAEPPEGPVALRAERVELERQRQAAEAVGAAATAEASALAELAAAALTELAIAATRGAPATAAVAALAELDDAEGAARLRGVDAALTIGELASAIARLDSRLLRAEAAAGAEAARLWIDVLVETAGEVALTIEYVVPGAAWRPYHRAVLDRTTGRVEWQTTACVWQATGEDWTAVALACSLERPSLGIAPPPLVDDELHTRKKPDQVVVEARERVQETTGLGGGPAQVPGIDDGGLGLVLQAPRASVRCDGAPHRIPVGTFTAAAQLSLVAIPLRSPFVHLRARLINGGGAPLLAGPVDLVMASGYVGRGAIGFVAAGEPFYLGFGPDAELRVHRTETKDRDDAGLLGGWTTTTTRVVVRVSNLADTKRELTVTERVPISEVEQVTVQLGAPDAFLLAKDDGGDEPTQVTARAMDERGIVTWAVELPPHGRKAVTLEYRVRSQRGVAGV